VDDMRHFIWAFSALLGATPLSAEPALEAVPAKSEAPLTAESFAAPLFIEEPELSPNGRRMAARLSVHCSLLLSMIPCFLKEVEAFLAEHNLA
jgi:hypothetical protein